MSEKDFEAAASFLPNVVGKLDSADLLYFYARFKQAKEGRNERPKPGFFEFQAKQKWQAWKDLGQMSTSEARQQYINRLTELEPEWRDAEGAERGQKGWVSVSTMQKTEVDVEPSDKTIVDYVKEGNLETLRKVLKADESKVDELDDQGMGLIHWAADRGSTAILHALIDAGANVNQTDSDGQTALHFAASCGHAEVIRLLLAAGACGDAKDADGATAADVADDEDVKQILGKMKQCDDDGLLSCVRKTDFSKTDMCPES